MVVGQTSKQRHLVVLVMIVIVYVGATLPNCMLGDERLKETPERMTPEGRRSVGGGVAE